MTEEIPNGNKGDEPMKICGETEVGDAEMLREGRGT
jgi:hypothetical protein